MNDIINAAFELGGAIFLCHNCITLYKDKAVAGVSILSTAFFTGWGVWNIYYYPTLDQFWSMAAAAALTFFNLIWVGQMIYYSRDKEPTKEEAKETTKQAVQRIIREFDDIALESITKLTELARTNPYVYGHLYKDSITKLYAITSLRMENAELDAEEGIKLIREVFGCSTARAKILYENYNCLCGDSITLEVERSM